MPLRRKAKSLTAKFVAAAVIASGVVPAGFTGLTAEAAGKNPQAVLTVDLDPAANTGEIIHGAAGFLYGVSSEDVPTTNTIVPLKSKILVTKGAVGTEHPYGDALDVAKTFLESGGEQIQMYNSNYYGVFGVTATTDQYCSDLENYICPAVVAWKAEWKEEHGGIILKQLRKLGASCDWDRTAFTMDEKRSESVIKVFVDLYNKGLIYRGVRMVNWDPAALTALSDDEVIYKEEHSKLYYLRYKIVGEEGYAIVTLPEALEETLEWEDRRGTPRRGSVPLYYFDDESLKKIRRSRRWG